MARTVSIGAQGFADLREHGYFLVDKTAFISQWWAAGDQVTLICRPRRFGKTLNLNMLECFFSRAYAGRADLFEGMAVWDDPALRAEQGAWPVIALSFAGVKEPTYEAAAYRMREVMGLAFTRHAYLEKSPSLNAEEREYVRRMRTGMTELEAPSSLMRLCELLKRHHGKRVIVLLDEYDTPMQEAWLGGYWDQMAAFVRSLFNNTFKTNPYLERAVLSGITRVSRESIFSDLNNLEVVTATSHKYADCFGFTQAEVDAAMDEMGLTDRAGVKRWYDGFAFGGVADIYNPWSITKYLDSGKLGPYWVNTSSNALVGRLVREGDDDVKGDFEELLNGGAVWKKLDEQVVFGELGTKPGALWALLLASGYVKVVDQELAERGGRVLLALTNREVVEAFDSVVRGWFEGASARYNRFVRALLAGDVEAMNAYLNDVALATFSMFDAGGRPAESEPERFYHGFVLGLLVELRGRYRVLSNRESGYGRYDVMLEPCDPARDDGIVIEFKVFNPVRGEKTLADTVAAAQAQIAEKRYAADLEARGVPAGRIRCYGFAFQGKSVLIG